MIARGTIPAIARCGPYGWFIINWYM